MNSTKGKQKLDKKTRSRSSIIILLLFLSVVIIISSSVLLFWKSDRAAELLQQALDNMIEKHELQVIIEEKSQEHELSFEGTMKSGKLQGTIPDYSLNILYRHKDNNLYIKDLKDNTWKNASEVGLGKLKSFFSSPFPLLYAASIDSNISLSEKEIINGEDKEKILSMHIPHNKINEDFGDLPAGETSINCLVYVEEEELFINRVLFFFVDNESSNEILQRSYSFR